ncbi:MAG: CAP domain-containing protein [Dehalococcoidia bacterium]
MAAALLLSLSLAPRTQADDPTAPGPEEQALLDLINDYRSRNGLGTLTLSPPLMATAQWMAQDMASNGYFSHTDSLGRSPFQRMAAFGYDYTTWKGENLAAGSSDPQVVFDLWRNSPSHKANLLRPQYTVVGIASAFSEDAAYRWYWALEMGAQADDGEEADETDGSGHSASEDLTPAALPAGASQTLAEGWNNIAYLGPTASPQSALASIADKYLVVFHWDAQAGRWLSHSPGAPPSINNLTALETFKAYWIYTTQPAILSFADAQ